MPAQLQLKNASKSASPAEVFASQHLLSEPLPPGMRSSADDRSVQGASSGTGSRDNSGNQISNSPPLGIMVYDESSMGRTNTDGGAMPDNVTD